MPRDLDAVLLSHAHIDHSGLLPRLVKAGFHGPIFATPATADLAGVMLPDSAHIQELEVEQLNRRNAHRSRQEVEPIYRAADAGACLERFRPVPYGRWFEALPGVRARFWNAGHLLGSASIELEARTEAAGPPLRLLFSGDVGPAFKLLQPDPEVPRGFDYVVCEATYGDSDRAEVSEEQRRQRLRDEVLAARRPAGALLIPSFAVERTQELLSDLVRLMDEGALPDIPIHVDSPLATAASKVFARHAAELEGGAALLRAFRSRRVRFTETVEQSKALDRLRGFHIVISASGMCEAGRIRYRLKNWLWRDDATVLLVGFQAQGTLGRILQEGAASVRIQGEDFKVRARIRSLDLYSGHADGPELARWVAAAQPIAHEVFLVHGEEPALRGLQARLEAVLPPGRVRLPQIDEGFELTPQGARSLGVPHRLRIEGTGVAHLDWHNDLSRLLLDINETVAGAADEKARATVLRRLRRALEAPPPGD